jgi:lipid A 3-O-deacylase
MIGVVPLGGRFSIGSGPVFPYIEFGAGCGWTDLDKLPEIDRRFNFTLQGGAGVRGALRDGQAWTLEARLSHSSNANTARPNISLNCLVLLAGWRFR